MPLVPMRTILEATDKYGFAQGAYNMHTASQAKALMEVHEMFRSPAIIQGAELACAFMGGKADFPAGTLEDKQKGAFNVVAAVKRYAENSPIPVAIHLDHGKSIEVCVAAMDAGYTSVMIDGSHLPMKENIELTREVVKLAHPRGVTVEGELGVLAGVEDQVFSETSTYTNPLDAVEFVKKTGVDALAISYGATHGANKGKNTVLRKQIAIAAKECLRHEGLFCALVSHGSSTVPQYIVREVNALGGQLVNAHGIAKEQLKELAREAIEKINVDTDIRLAILRNFRELFHNNPQYCTHKSLGPVYESLQAAPGQVDFRKHLGSVMDLVMYGTAADEAEKKLGICMEMAVKEAAGALIVEFDSLGKAPLVENVTLEQMAERYAEMK